jgi:hypothetical protein
LSDSTEMKDKPQDRDSEGREERRGEEKEQGRE